MTTWNGQRAYVGQPRQPTRSGVLVLPSIAGYNEHVALVSSQLQADGFVAVAWDPFWTSPADLPIAERARLGRALDDSAAQESQLQCIDSMYSELGLERIGVLGFCLGGRMALTLCTAQPALGVCVTYHPSISEPRPAHHLPSLSLAREIGCPVQVLYPGRDHVTRRTTFLALREALESRAAPTSVHVYPEADHGFTGHVDSIRGVDLRQNPANAAASHLAWPQSLALLHACLDSPSALA